MTDSYYLEILMPLFSKARPRLTKSGHAYMPASYKNNISEMRSQIKKQWTIGLLETPVELNASLYGEARGDLDNIIGSFMDAATGIIFTDDRVLYISKLNVNWSQAKKNESKWLISIKPL